MARRRKTPASSARRARRPRTEVPAASGGRSAAAANFVPEPEAPWNRMTVGRMRQHRLDLVLANCSITEVDARAYVLGLFREVAPSGAAGDIDALLGGAITSFSQRRMFTGSVGEVFIMPANRRRLRAEMVLFAGLGFFDQFNDNVQQIAAENVMRTFASTRIEDFATVLIGGAATPDTPQLVENLLRGILRGKRDADADHHFRRVVLCELNRKRYEEIRREVHRLSGTDLFKDVELTLSELPPENGRGPGAEAAHARAAAPAAPSEAVPSLASTSSRSEPVYLIVRQGPVREQGEQVVFSAVLPVTSKGAVVSQEKRLKAAELDTLLARARMGRHTEAGATSLGTRLGSLLLHQEVVEVLLSAKDRHLVVVHDAAASRTPWELLRLGNWMPALHMGMSRRLMSEGLSVAKYLEQRPDAAKLNVLLVVDPTGNLPGARREGAYLTSLLEARQDVQLVVLNERDKPTRARVRACLASGIFDVVHFACHAHFDEDAPERSGVWCTDDVLSGEDINGLGNLPRLAFFNACESGRIAGAESPDSVPGRATRTVPRAVHAARLAPAEAFLTGGIANFIGTYWKVSDGAARNFSQAFYKTILAPPPAGGLPFGGVTLGAAVLAGRTAVRRSGHTDWADYIHYGDQNFVLMKPPPAGR